MITAARQVDQLRRVNNGKVRVKGHDLRDEGAPFKRVGGRWQRLWGSKNYTGRGMCWCGAYSEVLQSDNARKAWHRQHKLDVLTKRPGL